MPSPSSILQTLRPLLLLSLSLSLLYLLLFPSPFLPSLSPPPSPPPPTSIHHLLFGISSSNLTLPRRRPYLSLWYRAPHTRALLFLDSPPSPQTLTPARPLPPIRVSPSASRFPFTFKSGLRSAVRVARIAKELVDSVADDGREVRWIVLGDDDTVFFPANLAATLGKYDWERWHYVGGLSESVEQNVRHSFGMAFGGGGIAISYSLAKVLARVLDSCLMRYGHLYGSDARVFACLAELGVALTRELGFHQVDLRGDLFGMLSAHPLTPVVSLHHLDNVVALFPGMNRTAALKQLFEAVNVDPGRIFQQTVCYDRLKFRTISVSWGYAVQVYEGNQLLPDLLSLQQTFTPWKRSRNTSSSLYMYNTRAFPRDPCKRPVIFFFRSVISFQNRTESYYQRDVAGNCNKGISSTKNLHQIIVSSGIFDLDIKQLQAPRRYCCDVFDSSSDVVMKIGIRKCKEDELIAMHM